LTIVWDMDDGTTVSDVQTVVHTHSGPGTYEVRVTITDTRGGQTYSTITLVVISNSPPVVEIDTIPVAVKGDTLSFDANVSDEDGDTMTFAWDFGDGDTSTWEAPKHIYAEPGTYTVTLTVTDSEEGVTVKTIEVLVEKPKKDDDDESPGFGTVIVLVALAGAFSVITRRRR